jgi:signal transduction histidine kinase
MCTSAALRGAELTNRLLAFARKQSLDPKKVDVNVLARGLEGLLVRALGENVEIRLVATKPVWPALADAAQLESAILNLCLNARDAMPRGGCLTIETADVEIGDSGADAMRELSPGAYVMIAVSDTGIGMDAATVARAVEPFFTTKEVGKGSGLGLSMVYGFVKQSHGHLTIRSQPGAGTTVQLYLPRSQETLAVDLPLHDADAPGGNEAILLVEDDDLVRAHVEAQLTALGYRISSAATASEAWPYWNARQISIFCSPTS